MWGFLKCILAREGCPEDGVLGVVYDDLLMIILCNPVLLNLYCCRRRCSGWRRIILIRDTLYFVL